MKTAVIVPNWNGEAWLKDCIESLLSQTVECTIIIVDNGSTDGSRRILDQYDNRIVTILLDKNYGFTGGVNAGITYAIRNDYDAVGLLNNDAIAAVDWLKELCSDLTKNTGIVTGLLLTYDGKFIDSTGEQMSIWGLPFPRSRRMAASSAPTEKQYIFAASGGATLYSTKMLRSIGSFDDDFFAYYEDVDLSYRAQLSGWRVALNPRAIAYHKINATSNRMRKGFKAYQTFKNLPLCLIKNTPSKLRRIIYPRFLLAYSAFYFKAALTGNLFPATRGVLASMYLLPRKLQMRSKVQKGKTVSDGYILNIMIHDLPPDSNIRVLRDAWWKISGRK